MFFKKKKENEIYISSLQLCAMLLFCVFLTMQLHLNLILHRYERLLQLLTDVTSFNKKGNVSSWYFLTDLSCDQYNIDQPVHLSACLPVLPVSDTPSG